MANPLIAEYQNLAASLDPLIQQLVADNLPIAAQQVGAAQGTLRAACITMIANDIDNLLSTSQDPQAAQAKAALTSATTSLQQGAQAITRDEKQVGVIVGVATAAAQIASSLVPLNVVEIVAAANSTINLLS